MTPKWKRGDLVWSEELKQPAIIEELNTQVYGDPRAQLRLETNRSIWVNASLLIPLPDHIKNQARELLRLKGTTIALTRMREFLGLRE